MAALTPILLLGSTALGAAGMVQQSRAQDAVDEANARQSEMRGRAELADATLKAERTRKDADRLIAKQRAIAAASGSGTGGSAAEIMGATAAEGEYDSALNVWLGRERQAGPEYSADMTRAEGKARRRALPLQIGGAVLSGVSQAYSRSPFAREQSPSAYRYG